nr:sugar ABC transporter permease [bacterium]
MVAPFMLLFTTFTVLPVLASIVLSFTNFNMLEWPNWVGWSNYITMFVKDDVFWIAVRNTLVFAFLTGPLSYVLALMLAWFINELPKKLRAFMTLCIYAPSITGGAYFIWTYIFSGDAYGLINGWLMSWGLIQEPILWLTDEKYMMTVLIIVQLWMSMGAGFLALIAGLRNVDHELYEAAAIDGTKNRWQELWYVTLPSIAPQMIFAAVLQIASSFAVADVSMNLAGFPSTNYAGHTIVLHMYDYGSVRYEMGYAAAIAVVLFAAMALTNSLIRFVFKKVDPDN